MVSTTDSKPVSEGSNPSSSAKFDDLKKNLYDIEVDAYNLKNLLREGLWAELYYVLNRVCEECDFARARLKRLEREGYLE